MPSAAGMRASKPLACNKIARPRKSPANTAENWGPRVENSCSSSPGNFLDAFLFNRLNLCSTASPFLPCQPRRWQDLVQYRASRGLGSGRGRLHRKGGGAGAFWSRHLGGPPHASAFQERRHVPARRVTKTRRGNAGEQQGLAKPTPKTITTMTRLLAELDASSRKAMPSMTRKTVSGAFAGRTGRRCHRITSRWAPARHADTGGSG
jgi:hypothetical protein